MGILDLFKKKKDYSGHFSNKASRKKGGALLHLRIDRDGRGLLMINGSRTFWLNETAAEFVKHAIQETPEAKAMSALRRRFAVSKTLAKRDLDLVKKNLARLGKSPDADPLDLLNVDIAELTDSSLSSPLHMYVYTTYEDPDRCVLDAVPPGRKVSLLSKREWEVTLERIEKIGVHYITLCGGEPTGRDDLEMMIAKASGMGLAVGLETNGARLSDRKYVNKLIALGLDAVTIKFYASDPKVFKSLNPTKRKGFYKDCVAGIKNAAASGLEVQAFIMVTKETVVHLEDTVNFLKDLGVKTVLLSMFPQSNPDQYLESSIGKEHMGSVLDLVKNLQGPGIKILMKTPIGSTQAVYGESAHLVDCTGGYTNMALEPNADVLVCRYSFNSLGNILADPWENIWDHPNAAKVRNREGLPSRCGECPDLGLCGGGCPQWLFITEEPAKRDYVIIEQDRKR